jgi:hypothetical protein
MLLISQLLTHWRRRLARVRTLASDPRPVSGDQWLWSVRARILSFLVTRYSDPAAARREQSLMNLSFPTLDPSLFEVEPLEVAPRSRRHLGQKLRAIHQSNFDNWRARRWRWFL